MKQKYGKWYARWTGEDGKRHEKACATKREAENLQRQKRQERLGKKTKNRESPR